jgi:nitric oxide synthase oxygenase domain/subunit
LNYRWKDKALVELNVAVLHSFEEYGVSIWDHHTACESFMNFFYKEIEERGSVPADWIWLTPPISGSTTPVFHQEMILYFTKPNLRGGENYWESYNWKYVYPLLSIF